MYRTMRSVFSCMAVLFLAVAVTDNVAAASDRGMIPVAMGGGSVVEATFQGGAEEEVTFSFFAGYEKDGNPAGSFHFRRAYPDGKVSVVLSTEITGIEPVIVDEENGCSVMSMTGIAKLIPGWKTDTPRNPRQGQQFTLVVEDCDGYSDDTVTDMIWFEVRYPNGNVRPGLSLEEHLFAVNGNIQIQ